MWEFEASTLIDLYDLPLRERMIRIKPIVLNEMKARNYPLPEWANRLV